MKRCKNCKSLFSDSMDVCFACGAEAPRYSTFGTMAGAFGKGMIYVLFFFLLQIVVTLAYSTYISVMAILGSYGNPSEIVDAINSKTSEISIVSGVLSILLLIVFCAIRKKNFFDRTRLNISPGAACIGAAALGISLNCLFVLLVALLPVPEAIIEQHEFVYQNLGEGNPVVEFLAAVIVAPLAEEIIFRGFCFGTMRRVMPFLPAMLISSAVFGLVHGTVMAFVYATLIGMLLSYFYEISGSLWTPVILHVGFNGGSYLADMLASEGSILFFGCCLIAPLLIVFCIRYYKKKMKKPDLSAFDTEEIGQ